MVHVRGNGAAGGAAYTLKVNEHVRVDLIYDIYIGAIPWLFLQVALVAIVIFWPGSVTYWLDKDPRVDPSTIEIRIPTFGDQGTPTFGLPPGPSTPDLVAPPSQARRPDFQPTCSRPNPTRRAKEKGPRNRGPFPQSR